MFNVQCSYYYLTKETVTGGWILATCLLTDIGYSEIIAYSYSKNIKYAVRFRSTSVWGGFVS